MLGRRPIRTRAAEMGGDERLRLLRGDLVAQQVDAIVNAANETLLGGGGVDGAIHRAAGPQLLQACRALPELRPGVRCPTGEARITPGFLLPARFVIHTVGPVWRGGGHGEPELLAGCYRRSLVLAREHGCRSIAFPAISTGVYGFPAEAAARIAVHECRAFLAAEPGWQEVLLVAYGADAAEILGSALRSE
jgi:O-acetyl-ADP-ribose deacetylase (regulator of RNase III)